MNNTVTRFLFYFFVSGLITWGFILAAPMYADRAQMFLSCSIAGAKWMIQVIAAFLLLKEKRWRFLERIAATCFLGSVLLLPYTAASFLLKYNPPFFFVASLLISVSTMIFLYRHSVLSSGLALKWWYAWLLCLALAISLQLTVVFHILR